MALCLVAPCGDVIINIKIAEARRSAFSWAPYSSWRQVYNLFPVLRGGRSACDARRLLEGLGVKRKILRQARQCARRSLVIGTQWRAKDEGGGSLSFGGPTRCSSPRWRKFRQTATTALLHGGLANNQVRVHWKLAPDATTPQGGGLADFG